MGNTASEGRRGESHSLADTLELSDLLRSFWEVPGQRTSLLGFSQDSPLKYIINGSPQP